MRLRVTEQLVSTDLDFLAFRAEQNFALLALRINMTSFTIGTAQAHFQEICSGNPKCATLPLGC